MIIDRVLNVYMKIEGDRCKVDRHVLVLRFSSVCR